MHAPLPPFPPQLTAVPFSKNTTFGAADVRELVGLLQSGEAAPWAVGAGLRAPGGGGGVNPAGAAPDLAAVVRPSRVRAMLASRACRSRCACGLGDGWGAKEGCVPEGRWRGGYGEGGEGEGSAA